MKGRLKMLQGHCMLSTDTAGVQCGVTVACEGTVHQLSPAHRARNQGLHHNRAILHAVHGMATGGGSSQACGGPSGARGFRSAASRSADRAHHQCRLHGEHPDCLPVQLLL